MIVTQQCLQESLVELPLEKDKNENDQLNWKWNQHAKKKAMIKNFTIKWNFVVPVVTLTKTCQTFSLAPSKEQNRILTPIRNGGVISKLWYLTGLNSTLRQMLAFSYSASWCHKPCHNHFIVVQYHGQQKARITR